MTTTGDAITHSFAKATRIEPKEFLDTYGKEDVEELARDNRDSWFRFGLGKEPPSWDLFMAQADWYLRNRIMGRMDVLGKVHWVSHEGNWQISKEKYPDEYKMLFVDWKLK